MSPPWTIPVIVLQQVQRSDSGLLPGDCPGVSALCSLCPASHMYRGSGGGSAGGSGGGSGEGQGRGGLDVDLEADHEAHGTPGGCTMASLMTLHIGRPRHMKCTPRAHDGPWAGEGTPDPHHRLCHAQPHALPHGVCPGHAQDGPRTHSGHTEGPLRACRVHARGHGQAGHAQGMHNAGSGHAQVRGRVRGRVRARVREGSRGGSADRQVMGQGQAQ